MSEVLKRHYYGINATYFWMFSLSILKGIW